MKKNIIINGLLRLLMVQFIFFSISNMVLVSMDTYESLFGNVELNPAKFINLKVLLIPIWILTSIIFIFVYFYRIKKTHLLIKKVDIKVFF